jgi:hypothetical protein
MPGIQGDRIDGTYGSWTAETNHTVEPEKIAIKFTPKRGTCKDVRLVQHVKAIGLDNDGKRIAKENDELFDDPTDNPYGWEKPDSVKNPGDVPVYIDHLKCEGDPYYNGDDHPQDETSKGDSTSTPPTPTEMTDGPGIPLHGPGGFDDIKADVATVHKIFETCAICIETGEILGCIWWSSVSSRTHQGRITVHTGQHDEPGSETMKKALKKFIGRHTRKDRNGKLHWFCPETGAMKGLVPEKYAERIFQSGISVRTLTRPSVFSAAPMSTVIAVQRGHVGGGALLEAPELALARSIASPHQAALKFTWSGAQEKTVPSLVFSALTDLSSADIAPHVRDEPRFANDFMGLRFVPATSDFMSMLLTRLQAHADELREITGVVTISIIGDIRGDDSFSYTGTLESSQLASVLDEVNPAVADSGPGVREALTYLSLNFARRRSIE